MLGPLLGKGGMGEVLEAWDVVLCRPVALKALRNVEPAAMIRFMHEAQIQARVVHPNICRIYDIESTEATLKIAMQLIKGPNLEQAARQLTQAEVVAIIQQIAEAVHAAHRANLIHRDLKPSNIILERTPEGGWVPYLCDFGLAVALGEPAMTLSRAVLGTPAFMAPEQRQGDRDRVGPATDVYSLGGTLHFALLGYPPQAGSLGRLPSRARATLPRPLEAILQKCLQEDPALRYPAASGLAEDLARFQRGDAVQTPSRVGRPRILAFLPKPGRRLLPVIGVLAVLGLALAGHQARRAARLSQEVARTRTLFLALGEDLATSAVNRAMAPHDLRPSRMALSHHLDQLRARYPETPEEADAASAFVLGRRHLLLGTYPQAHQAFLEAWRLGFQAPEIAEFLALAQLGRHFSDSGPLPQDLPQPAFQHAPGPAQTMLTQVLKRDFAAAAVSAQLCEQNHRFLQDPGGLQAFALCALARQRFLAGDLPGAAQGYQTALAAADRRLQDWKSHESLTHARTRARLGIAETALEQGSASPDLFTNLKQDTNRALLLEPSSPALQEDWVAARYLAALAEAERGGDPKPVLDEAGAFLETQVPKDTTPDLQTFRMAIYGQAAENALKRGQDAGPFFQKALQGSAGRTFLARDPMGDLLLSRARLEASRGEDPRPTLAALVSRLLPGDPAKGDWAALETVSEAWLLRAKWEKGAGLDPAASIASAVTLADRALAIRPEAPGANAIKGLATAMDPSRARTFKASAHAHLRAAMAPGGGGRAKRLVQELSRCL